MRQGERVLEDFVPFYGPWLLYFSYPLFYLVGGGILGTNILIHVIWPCLSLACAVGVAHLLFETKRRRMAFLLFVGFLDLPFIHYTSFLRVWVGVLAVALWARGVRNGELKYLFLAGAASALSFLFSPEVGVYVLLAVSLATVTSLRKACSSCPAFLGGFTVVLGPYTLFSARELSLYLSFAFSRTNYNWYSGSLFPSLAPSWTAIAFWGALFLQVMILLSLIPFSRRSKDEIGPRAVVALSIFSFTTAFSVPSLDHLRYAFPAMMTAACFILSVAWTEKGPNLAGAGRTLRNILALGTAFLLLLVTLPLFVEDHHSSPAKTLFDIGVTIIPREWKTAIRGVCGVQGEVQLPTSPPPNLPPQGGGEMGGGWRGGRIGPPPALRLFQDWVSQEDFSEMEQVTHYLLDHTNSGDHIYVCPRGPYNITTGRRNPTRFDRIEWALTPALRREMVSAVDAGEVPYIVYIKPSHPYNTVSRSETAYFLDEMLEEIGRNYTAEKQFSHTILFRRRDPDDEPAFRKKAIEGPPVFSPPLEGRGRGRLEGAPNSTNFETETLSPTGAFRISALPKQVNRVSFEVRMEYPLFLGNVARPKILMEVFSEGAETYQASIVVPTSPEFSALSFQIPSYGNQRSLYFYFVHGGALNPQPVRIHTRKILLEQDPLSILCNGY